MSRCLFLPALLLGTSLMTIPDTPTAAAQPDKNAEDARLAKLFQSYLDQEFRRHPYFATQQGNHDFDDMLDDLSSEARKKDVEVARGLLATLPKEIDVKKLSRDGQIDYEIWTHVLNYSLWSVENDNRFEFDPRVYGEYISDSVFLLLTQSSLPRERNVENAARRIRFIPKIVEAAKAGLKNPPKVLTEIAIKRNLGAISFYEKEIYAFAKETPSTEPLATPCKEAVKALKDYQSWLEKELLPKSTGDWRLGKEKFAKKLEMELDAGLTADEVVKLAEAEADRVEREMY